MVRKFLWGAFSGFCFPKWQKLTSPSSSSHRACACARCWFHDKTPLGGSCNSNPILEKWVQLNHPGANLGNHPPGRVCCCWRLACFYTARVSHRNDGMGLCLQNGWQLFSAELAVESIVYLFNIVIDTLLNPWQLTVILCYIYNIRYKINSQQFE